MSTLKVDAIGKFDTTANAITFDSNNNASFTGSVNATNPIRNKNLLTNGGMNVWQRSTSYPSWSTDDYSTVDRFLTRVRGGAVYTISRSTDVPSAQGFGYSLKFDNTTADASPTSNDFTLLEQRIEGQNLQHLLKGTSSAKKLTLSFWIKSNLTGTFIARLYDDDNTRSISKSYTISSANTWEKKEIVFEGDQTGTLDNDNAVSLRVQLWFSAGTDYTSGTLQTAWGSAATIADIAPGISNLSSSTSNELYITGVQLEIGEAATNFEFEPYETVLRKCERYFLQYGGNSSYNWICIGSNVTSTTFDGVMHFPTTMRIDPVLSTVGNWNVYDGAIDTTSGWSNIDGSERIGGVRATTSTQTVGNCSRVYANNDSSARFKFDAEL